MKGKKRFIIWMFPFFAAFLFLLWQGKNLVMEEKEERQIWQVWAELPEGEITEKILKSMKKFPGVERLWTVLETEISVSVKEYRGSSSLQGVDLKDYPLTVIQSAGKKNLGNIPLLAVGEDFFQQLQDVGENPVSKRQQVILRENLSSLVVEILSTSRRGAGRGGREYSGRISRGGKGEGDLYGAGTNAPVAGK